MKKHFLAFSLVAVVIATFLAGCGDDATGCTPDATIFEGTDTGSHKVYVNGIYGIVPDISDTLTGTATSSTTVDIYDNALKQTLKGTIDAVNCNKITLDSLIYGPGDTLVINSSTLGVVKIYNIRAGGTGTISGTTVTTSIKIKKGNTNLGILPSLTNVELKGTFKVLP
jgi:hypothetical protein